MASGKSTIGRALAVRMRRPFVDNDDSLEVRTGQTAREIADAQGADALHALEAETLLVALEGQVAAVIAAAAAAPMEARAAAAMRAHDVVYLRAAPDLLAGRLARSPHGDDHRPFVGAADGADLKEVLVAQFAERDDRYRALATLVVDVGAETPDRTVEKISAALAR
jgi:shikimate kinase